MYQVAMLNWVSSKSSDCPGTRQQIPTPAPATLIKEGTGAGTNGSSSSSASGSGLPAHTLVMVFPAMGNLHRISVIVPYNQAAVMTSTIQLGHSDLAF